MASPGQGRIRTSTSPSADVASHSRLVGPMKRALRGVLSPMAGLVLNASDAGALGFRGWP